MADVVTRAPRLFEITPRRALAVLALAAVMLLFPLPEGGRPTRALGDFLHAPCFAVLTAIIFAAVRAKTAGAPLLVAAACWLLLAGFGFLMEYLQGFVNRDVNYHDAVANVTGVTIGLLWSLCRVFRNAALSRILLAMAGVMLIVVSLRPALMLIDVVMEWREFPRLSSLEGKLELSRWFGHNANYDREEAHATHGDWSLRAEFQAGKNALVVLTPLQVDWTPFQEFVFDLTVLPESEAGPAASALLEIVVSAYDVHHNCTPEDRFQRVQWLGPGKHQVRIPVTDIAVAPESRMMDLGRMSRVRISTRGLERPRTVYLDHFRLE